MNSISKNNLFLIRKEKIKKEITSAKKLLQNNIEPLKVADDFLSNSFKLIKDSIRKRNPNFSEQELSNKIKSNINMFHRIKSGSKF